MVSSRIESQAGQVSIVALDVDGGALEAGVRRITPSPGHVERRLEFPSCDLRAAGLEILRESRRPRPAWHHTQ